MAELILRKREAMHAGEIGLFVDSEVFESDFATIKMNADVEIKATQSRSLKQMRLAWGLARKVAMSGALPDADDAKDCMDFLKIKCRHVRYIHDTHNGEVIIVPKSIRFAAMDQTAFQRFFNRALHIVVTEILPGVPEGVLREEIEKMAGVDAPEPDKPKPARQRRTKAAAMPEPVSVIPPADDDFPGDRPLPESPVPMAPTPPPSGTPAPSLTPAAQNDAAAQAPPLPKNAADWAIWCRAWLAAFEADPTKTDQDAMIRWNNERGLRNDCGVTSEDRQPVFVEYNNTIERMRARK